MKKYFEGSKEFNEIVGKTTLDYFKKIDEFVFPIAIDDTVKCMSDVRNKCNKKVNLMISEKEPFRIEFAKYQDAVVQRKKELDQYKRDCRDNEIPPDTAVSDKINSEIEKLTSQATIYCPDIPDFVNNYLGIYTTDFPLLDIYNQPTIVLFRDSVENYAITKGWGLPEVYSMVYAHELFHAFFDSPDFNKTPDCDLEETMAQFGMLTLFKLIFNACIFGEAACMSSMDFNNDEDCLRGYYGGFLLFSDTEKMSDDYRFKVLDKYRSLSGLINLQEDSNSIPCKRVYSSRLREWGFLETIREILNSDYWYHNA